jgi:hypothetical protein
METVTAETICDCRDRLVEHVGSDFVSGLDRRYRDLKQGSQPGWLKDALFSQMHPIYRRLLELRKACDTASAKDGFHHTAGAVFLLYLLDDLEILRDNRNMERILDGLRDESKFFSAAFEVHVAAHYKLAGWMVEIPEESGHSGKQWDLTLSRSGQSVYVEVKSLDDREATFETKQVPREVCRALVKKRRSYQVHIDLLTPLDGPMHQTIVQEVLAATKANSVFDATAGGKFRIRGKKIAEWDSVTHGGITIPPISEKPEFAEVHVEVMPTQAARSRNLVLISISRRYEHNLPTSVRNALDTAGGQLPKSGPGIVHIQIPTEDTERVLGFADDNYSAIYREINRNTERVNAVVLTARAVDIDQRPPIVEEHYVVPNYSVRSELPTGFAIMGSRDLGIPLDQEACTIDMKFAVPSAVDPSRDATVYSHCTGDGRSQLKIWTRKGSLIRCELVSPFHARAICECEKTLVPGKNCRFTATWDRKHMRAWVDGQGC